MRNGEFQASLKSHDRLAQSNISRSQDPNGCSHNRECMMDNITACPEHNEQLGLPNRVAKLLSKLLLSLSLFWVHKQLN